MENNFYKTIASLLVYFWGIVFVLYIINLIIGNIHTIEKTKEKIVHTVITKSKEILNSEEKMVSLPLKKVWGARFEGVQRCDIDLKHPESQRKIDPHLSWVVGNCWNGVCEIKVAFKQTIPSEVTLYVKEGQEARWKKRTFEVKKPMVMGYQLSLHLDEAMRKKLGIPMNAEKIRLKQASGYMISMMNGVQELLFDYNKVLPNDTIIADGKEIGKINFVLK